MTRPTTPFDRALEEFTRDMKWGPDRTEMEKTLVLGNLNGFVALLNKKLLETSDAEILAAVSPEDLAAGREIVDRALRGCGETPRRKIMGNPAYDARREAEQAEAEKNKAAAEAGKAALDAFTAFMTGRAYIQIGKSMQGDTMITIGRR